MFKKRAPDPHAAAFAVIENWRSERLAEHEAYLYTYPDAHLVEAQRTQFAAVIDARAAELRAALVARTPR